MPPMSNTAKRVFAAIWVTLMLLGIFSATGHASTGARLTFCAPSGCARLETKA